MSLKDQCDAMQVFAQVESNSTLMRNVVLYFLAKFPQHANAALVGPNAFLNQTDFVNVNIPECAEKRWVKANYRFSRAQVKEWARLFNLPVGSDTLGGKILAIKQCRADTDLGLKFAKDVCEFVSTLVW